MGRFENEIRSLLNLRITLRKLSILPSPKDRQRKKRAAEHLSGFALRLENTLDRHNFYRKCVWYIFILSVTVGLVKKIVLTFQGLGGNMKAK